MTSNLKGKWVTFLRENGRWSLYHRVSEVAVVSASSGGPDRNGDVIPADALTGEYYVTVCGSAYPVALSYRQDDHPPLAVTCLDCYTGRHNDDPLSVSVGAHWPRKGTGELRGL